MEFRVDKGTGYMYCYAPKHFLANNAGKVLEHVYVAYRMIGRKLMDDECVHHKDRVRSNNSPSNLVVMTRSEHAKLHSVEDSGTEYTLNICKSCMTTFITTVKSSRVFCSSLCSSYGRRRFEVSADELSELVWEIPTTEVAKIFGVSDSAVSKRCRLLGVSKPPRGYWAKKRKS